MPSPFPGMDPYLEDPALFPDLHDRLIAFVSDWMNQHLPSPFYTTIASRVWMETSGRAIEADVNVLRENGHGKPGRTGDGGVAVETEPVVIHVPQYEVRETLLELRSGPKQDRLVGVLEILRPANKSTAGQGRSLYQRKQREYLDSPVHLIEIDLLRAGLHTTAVPEAALRQRINRTDYHVCVHRHDRPEDFLIYPIALGDRLPNLGIPLLPDVPVLILPLQEVFDRVYDSGQYRRRVDYTAGPPAPALAAEQREWLDQRLREQGLRTLNPESPTNPG